MHKLKKIFKTTGTKNGTYSIGLTVLVIAIVVVINLIFGQLPEKYRNIDVSSTKIYNITNTSKKLLKDLNHKVTFTVLADKEKTDDRIKTFLSKYAGLSKDISVKWIDPVLHPSALTEHNTKENTIVVACADTGKSTIVNFSDIIVMDTSSYYYTGQATESQFDGEGQLTSAVNYVTSNVTKNIYRTSGHGEASLSDTVTKLMDKNDYTVKELNLLMTQSIPSDCDLMLMYEPAKDLTKDELKAVQDYLSKGGKVMILLGDTSSKALPNIASVMKEYGMQEEDGYIADPTRCYQGNYYYIFPTLSLPQDMMTGISSQMVLLTNSHGMNMVDAARDSIVTTPFMQTSENSYAVTENSQKQGTYTLGAVATEEIKQDSASGHDKNSANDSKKDEDKNDSDKKDEPKKESRLTVISAGSLIDSKITDTFTQLENTTVFMNAVTGNFDGVKNISIEPKSLKTEHNTVIHAGMFSLLVIFGIPLLILISGFAVWFRRRKA